MRATDFMTNVKINRQSQPLHKRMFINKDVITKATSSFYTDNNEKIPSAEPGYDTSSFVTCVYCVLVCLV